MALDDKSTFDDNFFERCRTCQHCYKRQNDDDYVYCRKENGKCEYEPYKSRNEKKLQKERKIND